MIITRLALAYLTQHNVLSADVALLLASHMVDGVAKLVWCNWSLIGDDWQDFIDLKKLATHYDFDVDTTEFVATETLNADIPEQQLLLSATTQVQQYVQGKRLSFDLVLDTSLGTLFQQQVWRALQAIPHGETISYATLAKRVDNPKGYRAVANANGKNPLSIIIPCHRVIASDGRLGGYTGGLDKKEFLLALEGQTIKRK